MTLHDCIRTFNTLHAILNGRVTAFDPSLTDAVDDVFRSRVINWAIGENMRRLRPHVEGFVMQDEKLIADHDVDVDDDGNFENPPKAFLDERQELLNQEVEINLQTVSLDKLENEKNDLPRAVIAALSWMFVPE